MREVGADKTVLAIYFRQPYVPGYDKADTLFPFGFGLTFEPVQAAPRTGPAARGSR